MSRADASYQRRVRQGRIVVWLAQRACDRSSVLHVPCRWLLGRLTRLEPEDDFMRDEWIDNDEGYDPEELARYQDGGR